MSEMSCFNCMYSKKFSSGDNSAPKADCKNKEVEEQLFSLLDEYELPFYCRCYKFKQAS